MKLPASLGEVKISERENSIYNGESRREEL
jgi:hypothetical protein